MIIEIKKIADGRPSLTCIRDDGSRTWARMHPAFPLHDLTHYAVEGVFKFDEAFFGLISKGWEIDDFTKPGAAAKTPSQSILVEHLVALIERNAACDANELNKSLRSINQIEPGSLVIKDKDLLEIQELRKNLFGEWFQLPQGEKLSLVFPLR